MRTEIKELHQRLKTTSIYVTHDQIEAMTMADKIVVMRDGIVEQIGEPLDLYDRPANLFVAGFIGSPAMNFFKGRIESGRFVADGGVALPLANGARTGRASYGIRPEHVKVADDGVPGDYCGGPCTNSDPFLVIGAEKYDAGPAYPSYSGWIDEVRISDVLRYSTRFTPWWPLPDAHTMALYHFTCDWQQPDLVRDDVTGDLYAASDFGVMRLPSGTTTWVVAGTGLPRVEVAGLTIVPGARKLYAATHGRSAWQLTLP